MGAAIRHYKELAPAAEGRGRALDLVMVHARTFRVFEYVEAGDRDGLASYLNDLIVRLVVAVGAEFVVVPPAVTPHCCIRELMAISPLSVLSIFEPLVRETARRNIQRVSVFGSEPVMKAGLYGQLGDIEVVGHRPKELQYLRESYQALLDTGVGTAEQHAGLTALAHTILERDHVDAIVLAGTDLALVFNESNTDLA